MNYTARTGNVYDGAGRIAGTARSANGRDLERHAAALELAREQRQELEQLESAVRRLAATTPRDWREPWPRDYKTGRAGYPLAADGIDPAHGLDIIPTDGGHVHATAPSGQRVTFHHRGHVYECHPSQHAYRHPDGTWQLEHPDPVQNEPRNGAGRLYGADNLPEGGRARLRAALLDAVRTWTAAHPAELEAADLAALNNAAQRREATIAKLAGELLEQLEQLRTIEGQTDEAPRY